MTIHGQHGKRHLYFSTVLVYTILAVIFTSALTAAGLPGDQTGKHKLKPMEIKFEFRLDSYQKMEGWELGLFPEPESVLWRFDE
jgi:hypothetical protein